MVEWSQPDRQPDRQLGAQSAAWRANAAEDDHDHCRRGWARLEARRARLRSVVEADDGGETGGDPAQPASSTAEVDRVAAAEEWLAGADAAVRALTADLERVPGAVVSDRLRRVSVVAERVQAAMARLAGALDTSAQWSVEGATSARAWLMGEAGVGPATAGRSVAVGRLADRFPATGDALAAGTLTVSKAEVLAAAALAKGRHQLYGRDEAVLLAAASALDLHDFTLAVRRWAHLADDELDNGEPAAAFERRGVSFAPLASGNLRVDGELDATGGTLLLSAFLAHDEPDPIDDQIPPRTVRQRRADFLAALAARALSDANAEGSAPIATVDVLVDVAHLAAISPLSPKVAGRNQHHDGDPEAPARERHGDDRTDDGHRDPDAGGVDQRDVDRDGPGDERHAGARHDQRDRDDGGVDQRAGDDGGVDQRGVDQRAGDDGGVDQRGVDQRDRDDGGADQRGVDQRGVDRCDSDRSSGPSPGNSDDRVDVDPCDVDPAGRGAADGGGPSFARLLRWSDVLGTGPRPSPTLVQLLCDSWVGRLVMAGPDEPLAVGRRTRTWSAAQRRAIIARDGHCTHGRCTRGPEWCQIHHLEPWEAGGQTSVDNGTLRCLWHHTHHHVYLEHAHRPLGRGDPGGGAGP